VLRVEETSADNANFFFTISFLFWRKVLRVEETRAGSENRHRYEEMIKSLKGTIKHKHASVRQVAVSALGALLMCGDKAQLLKRTPINTLYDTYDRVLTFMRCRCTAYAVPMIGY